MLMQSKLKTINLERAGADGEAVVCKALGKRSFMASEQLQVATHMGFKCASFQSGFGHWGRQAILESCWYEADNMELS
eukprot:1517907-Amphidinium_carterae.1